MKASEAKLLTPLVSKTARDTYSNNLCHWATFPCYHFVVQASPNTCIYIQPSVLLHLWLGIAGRHWDVFQRHALVHSWHLISYLPFTSPFFFPYNIYHPHFHLSQVHSLSAYWPIVTTIFFFYWLPTRGREEIHFFSFLLPFHIFFFPLCCICDLQPSVWSLAVSITLQKRFSLLLLVLVFLALGVVPTSLPAQIWKQKWDE